jgi:uncharacterized membrane protein
MRQPVTLGAVPPVFAADPLASPDARVLVAALQQALHPRTASVLCYVPGIGWIISIVVLAADRFRHDRVVRFHAFQGLYLFVAWLMADWVLRPMFDVFLIPRMQIYRIVEIVLLGMSVFMMLKAGQNEAFSLPLFGELAHRSVAED